MAFVYALRSADEDLFKIGRTRGDLEARIKQLSTGNPHPLTRFDVIETEHDALCETCLHRKLRTKRCVDGEAREFFAVQPAELEDAIRDAREFLDEFVPKQREADRLAKEESDGHILKPGQEEWEAYRRVLQIREQEDDLSLDRALVETRLKLAMGRAAGLDRVATWKSHTVKKFDEAAFRLAEPDRFQDFVRESRIRKFRLL